MAEEKLNDENLPESMEHMEQDDDDIVTLLSANGEWVLAPTFRYVSAVSDGAVVVYDNAFGWRLLCKMKG